MVGGGEDVIEIRVEVGDVVVDVVCDAFQVCDEAGVGFAEGVFGFAKAREGVADVEDGIVGVASGLEEGCWHAGAVINLCFRVSNALCSDGVQFQG